MMFTITEGNNNITLCKPSSKTKLRIIEEKTLVLVTVCENPNWKWNLSPDQSGKAHTSPWEQCRVMASFLLVQAPVQPSLDTLPPSIPIQYLLHWHIHLCISPTWFVFVYLCFCISLAWFVFVFVYLSFCISPAWFVCAGSSVELPPSRCWNCSQLGKCCWSS